MIQNIIITIIMIVILILIILLSYKSMKEVSPFFSPPGEPDFFLKNFLEMDLITRSVVKMTCWIKKKFKKI